MSGLTLNSTIRANLLSLQGTAGLLAETQKNLSTGKKVNTALDNPTNFFTAATLDARANDLINLKDGIDLGGRVLEAADKGLTSSKKLLESLQSVGKQALQTTIGFSTKSQVNLGAITGATGDNLLGTLGVSTAAASTALTAGGAAATATSVLSTLDLTTAPAAGNSFTINGKTVTFAATGAATTASNGNVTIGIDQTVGALTTALDGIFSATGGSASFTAGKITLNTGTSGSVVLADVSGAPLAKLGLTPGTTSALPPVLSGKTLTIGATVPGNAATNITFGTGAGQVSTLNQLNDALAPNNLQATISSSGAIAITTQNDVASKTIGAVGGTSTGASNPFGAITAALAPIADPTAQAARRSLVDQFNTSLREFTNIINDSSFNGINLLNGDDLNLVFNETGSSRLQVKGVNFTAGALGLSNLTNTDFEDNLATNKVLKSLDNVNSKLRSQGSVFGANSTVVTLRKDFLNNMKVTLQSGAADLTLADTNELGATAAALQTRQQIGFSALAQSTGAEQGVLQLLR